MRLRDFIPSSLRLLLKLWLRRWSDFRSGQSRLFARKAPSALGFNHYISLEQPIRNSSYFENKIHNIQQGIKEISNFVVEPGQIFSFWQSIGHPNSKNGYKVGRNIISGVLTEDFGGGLCQLASIIYHCSLLAGLEILERHHHSVDIYQEQERFTPLGADATIVFGYKDLRIKNNLFCPIRFVFECQETQLICKLASPAPITKRMIVFERLKNHHNEKVITKDISEAQELVKAISVYKKILDV